jgi:hypothetical protein
METFFKPLANSSIWKYNSEKKKFFHPNIIFRETKIKHNIVSYKFLYRLEYNCGRCSYE